MDSGTIAGIVTTIITVLVALGVNLTFFFKVLKALGKSGDVLSAIDAALEDNELTEAEVDMLIEKINAARGAWGDVFAERRRAVG